MKSDFSVSLAKIINEFSLETIYLPKNADDILISSAEVNRPGLQLAGYYEFFDSQRVQVIGKSEESYLCELSEKELDVCMDSFFSRTPSLVIVSRGLDVPKAMQKAAKKYAVPLLRTSDSTSGFMAAIISFLNVQLAPRITRHGVLVEVYGEGILILGESGIGKSEAAVELMKRGHRLVADDAVEIRRVSSKTLVGSSPEIIRHFIEMRGIGIIDVKKIFGMGAVKDTEKIDLVIQLEAWQKGKQYDRLGLVDNFTEILGIQVPSLTIPIRPGRNLAVIFEIAAMNNRQRRMGYNAAEELNNRLMEQMGEEE